MSYKIRVSEISLHHEVKSVLENDFLFHSLLDEEWEPF